MFQHSALDTFFVQIIKTEACFKMCVETRWDNDFKDLFQFLLPIHCESSVG